MLLTGATMGQMCGLSDMVARGVGGATVLIYDEFDDTANTPLSSHAIAPTNTPATTWTELNGNWSVASNGNVQESSAGGINYFAVVNAGVSDCVITLVVTFPAGDTGGFSPGVCCRMSDSDNGWFVFLNAYSGSHEIDIRLVESGSQSNQAVLNVPSFEAGSVYNLAVTLSGENITAVLNGTYSVNFDTATFNQTVTHHGLVEYRDSLPTGPSSFNSFEITG